MPLIFVLFGDHVKVMFTCKRYSCNFQAPHIATYLQPRKSSKCKCVGSICITGSRKSKELMSITKQAINLKSDEFQCHRILQVHAGIYVYQLFVFLSSTTHGSLFQYFLVNLCEMSTLGCPA